MSYGGKAQGLTAPQVDHVLGSWLESELELLGVLGQSARRRTRDKLSQKLANAMKGQFAALEEQPPESREKSKQGAPTVDPLAVDPLALSPVELQVLGDEAYPAMAAARAAMSASISAARSAENRDDIALQLFEVQDQVRELQLQQHESNVRASYERRIERRDATIRVLQAQCDALTHELHEVRTRSEQTQRTLEDALLERSIEVAELRARQQQADQKLFSQRASFPASNDTDTLHAPRKVFPQRLMSTNVVRPHLTRRIHVVKCICSIHHEAECHAEHDPSTGAWPWRAVPRSLAARDAIAALATRSAGKREPAWLAACSQADARSHVAGAWNAAFVLEVMKLEDSVSPKKKRTPPRSGSLKLTFGSFA